MKLTFKKPFSLELDETTLEADFNELTKKQLKELDKKNQVTNRLISKNQRLLRDLDDAKAALEMSKNTNNMPLFEENRQKILKLEREIDDIDFTAIQDNTEKLYFERLKLSISGGDAEAILDLAKQYSAKMIFDTIIEDIQERAKKK